jgi:DNA repair protein RecN (Recombination protein N)
MLATLRIKNLALVDDLTLELVPGFNAITGETGAGKSILIGALNLVLGERADRTLIRGGAESCAVEAVFQTGTLARPIAAFLEENGLEPCEGGELLLKRVFTAAGTNKQFINGSPATLAVLKQLGELLVDIHGPHDHQSLLHAGRQLGLLDAFGGLQDRRDALGKLLRQRGEWEARKAELIVDERTYAQQLDLLRHQVKEIEAARLKAGEDEELEAEYQRASNASQLLQITQSALGGLADGDDALLDRAGEIGRLLHDLERLDPATSELRGLHEQALEQWRELQLQLSRYADRVEVDPGRLAELEERLNLFQSLKRKYGGSLAEIMRFGADARERLAALESRDAELERLNGELTKLDRKLTQQADELSAARKKLLPKLSRAATRELQALGFAQSHFEIALAVNGVITGSGRDACEFQFAPNVGEPPRPLRAIASSGEMARVMLALKTVLAAQDQVPVLVFDEVDANVGGETAQVVGRKMAEIGTRRQVLCITHLPAVAAAAPTHFEVRKSVRGGRTVTELLRLEGEARVNELTRMLGGQSAAARQHAEALLKAGPA